MITTTNKSYNREYETISTISKSRNLYTGTSFNKSSFNNQKILSENPCKPSKTRILSKIPKDKKFQKNKYLKIKNEIDSNKILSIEKEHPGKLMRKTLGNLYNNNYTNSNKKSSIEKSYQKSFKNKILLGSSTKKNNFINKCSNLKQKQNQKIIKFSFKNIPKDPKQIQKYLYQNHNNLIKINNIVNKATAKKRHKNNNISTNFINSYSNKEKKIKNLSLNTNIKAILNKNSVNDNSINQIKKENEFLAKLSDKYKSLIKKLKRENLLMDKKINSVLKENKNISNKISTLKENQEQLILVVKIIQGSGIKVEEIIEKWNNSIDYANKNTKANTNEIGNREENEKNKSLSVSMTELDSQIDSSSFIPITVEELNKNKIQKRVFTGIPKLNFDKIQGTFDEEND